ncbi:MAG: toxin HicA [Anaerolineae bacterium]
MARVDKILAEMQRNPKGIRFNDLCQVCDFYFGSLRQVGGSHRIYKTPWQGDPRVNIQDQQGMAKPYQVRQVLKAVERLEAYRDSTE